MNITLDQMKALDAIVRLGTLQKAANELGKSHTAVLYLIRNLESQTGVQIFDRSHYRNQLTEHGHTIYLLCKDFLIKKDELDTVCTLLRTGWDSKINIVYDGAVDLQFLLNTLAFWTRGPNPPSIQLEAAYLNDVEEIFAGKKADFMITVVPLNDQNLRSVPLEKIEMVLVRSQALQIPETDESTTSIDLTTLPLVAVRDNSNLMRLPTDSIRFKSKLLVHDFNTKKEVILNGLGIGWLPVNLIKKELKSKKLQKIQFGLENTIFLFPRLYFRPSTTKSKRMKSFLKSLTTK